MLVVECPLTKFINKKSFGLVLDFFWDLSFTNNVFRELSLPKAAFGDRSFTRNIPQGTLSVKHGCKIVVGPELSWSTSAFTSFRSKVAVVDPACLGLLRP